MLQKCATILSSGISSGPCPCRPLQVGTCSTSALWDHLFCSLLGTSFVVNRGSTCPPTQCCVCCSTRSATENLSLACPLDIPWDIRPPHWPGVCMVWWPRETLFTFFGCIFKSSHTHAHTHTTHTHLDLFTYYCRRSLYVRLHPAIPVCLTVHPFTCTEDGCTC